MASQITSLMIVRSTVYSGADQGKHQSSASLAFVWGIHRGPVNSPHKRPVKRKMFPFDDVIMVHDDVMAQGMLSALLGFVRGSPLVTTLVAFFVFSLKNLLEKQCNGHHVAHQCNVIVRLRPARCVRRRE